jgi:hypothetical protein
MSLILHIDYMSVSNNLAVSNILYFSTLTKLTVVLSTWISRDIGWPYHDSQWPVT